MIKTKQWSVGGGSATIQYDGQGDGNIIITSDANSLYEARSMQIVVETTDGSSIQKVVAINQAAKQRIDLSAAVVTASNQTYSGSAKTPTPTVTLNGSTVPSSGYDVSYSNNTNAGTATITVTGKGDYTGTASGTFNIAKANPTYTAPAARSLTYSGSAQYLTTTGSTSHGTIQYSNDGTNWYTTRRQGTNAGSYTTYWRLIGDSNHNDVASTSISVTISQATGSVTTTPTARSITYTGSSQYLVTAGSGTGTMYYRYRYKSYSASSWGSWSSYSTSRPSRTNAGYYEVQYYAAASSDGNYTQSATGTVSVTMNKASRTISFSSHPSTLYVGSSGTLSASASAGSSDGTISFSSSNSNVASISGSKLTGVGSGSCTIYATISEGSNYLSASTSYSQTINAVPSGCVNMGLPSGLLWAEKNIGASSAYSYECSFFSWGNTDGHTPTSSSSFSSYSFGSSNSVEPYVSSAGAALTGDIPLSQDAAHVNLGSPWRMPTSADFKELFDNIKYINADGTDVPSSSADKRVTVNGILGIYIESKINGNRLFFASSGFGNGTSWYSRGSNGYYWSSTLYSSDRGYNSFFYSNGVGSQVNDLRYHGFPVRAVRN